MRKLPYYVNRGLSLAGIQVIRSTTLRRLQILAGQLQEHSVESDRLLDLERRVNNLDKMHEYGKILNLSYNNAERFLLNEQDCKNLTELDIRNYVDSLINKERYKVFRHIIWWIACCSGIRGDYHEYGIFGATTFRMVLTAARVNMLSDMKFFAFDSFRGFPKIEGQPEAEGQLAMSKTEFWRAIKEHGIYLDKIETIEGYYHESLTPELQKRLLENKNKIAFANIDCDLYESAVPVFEFIEPLLQEGSVVYVDEYYASGSGNPHKGVPKAFAEFAKRSRFKFRPYLDVGSWGKAFIAYTHEAALTGDTDPILQGFSRE